MKWLLILALLFAPVTVNAAGPYLVANPYVGADYFQVTGLPSAIPGTSTINPDILGVYAFSVDLALLPAGNYTVTAKACSYIWGCSVDSAPFVFTRPDLAKAVAGIKLQK